MKTETYIDKSTWPAGRDEPDRVSWTHRGVPCLMVRSESTGAWCGYAATVEGHPWYGQEPDAQVHGGVTFAGPCHGTVCHVPEPGEPDHVWWIGFDCAHYMDLAPRMEALMGELVANELRKKLDVFLSYRDQGYVMKEVEDLAEQICAARP